jgi:protein-S-isoprenylcysteine O-methyltransferase Ste14
VSLLNRWTDLIYETATGSWRVRLILAPIAAALFLSLIISFILLSLVFDRWLGFPKVSSYPLSPIVGSCLIIFGAFLMLFSIAHFLRLRGTPVSLSPPPKLVTTGPYRFTRNPMLTGLFILLFGLGISLGSLSLVFIFTPLFIIMNVWELKKVEEPELARRLGKAYVEYKKRVPMFFPFFTKK